MATTQHGLANGHEIGDSVVAIADELLMVRRREDVDRMVGELLLGGCSQ